jgi:LPS export ABC transporter protein LptC
MFRWCGIIIVLIGMMFCSACTNDLKDVMAIPGNKLSPSQVGDSITMIYTDSAQLKLILKANRMLMFNKNVTEPFTVMPRGVFVTFFDDNEKISTTMSANYGVRYDLTKRMEARYKVVIVNIKGDKLETEKIIWDENNKRIYTDAFFTITTQKEIIKGYGLESNESFTKYQMKNITGKINLKENEL